MVAVNKAIDRQSLKALSPLGKLTHDKIDDIISKSHVKNIQAGRIIFRQGDDDGHTIYLLSGQIELTKVGKTRKQLIKAKSVDAKFPIANESPRPATARAKTASSLLYIDSSLLEILLDDNPSGEYEVTEIDVSQHATDWMMRFLQSRAFLKLPTADIQKVLMRMEEIHVQQGDKIIRQGDDGDYYYIIKSGCCYVSRKPAKSADEIKLAKLVEGDGFGEEALITKSKRNATVIAQEHCTLMRLNKSDFLELLVNPLVRNVHINSLKNSLYKNSEILDIRSNSDFKNGSLDNAKHIPLSMFRLRIPTLDLHKQYLVYSEDKDDAKAAAFLLTQHGIDCLVIIGSLNQFTPIIDDEQAVVNEVPVTRKNEVETPNLSIVKSDAQPVNPPHDTTTAPPSNPDEYKRAEPQTKSVANQATSNNTASPLTDKKIESIEEQKERDRLRKLRDEVNNIRKQTKINADKMLEEANAIRETALKEAASIRNKIEKEETLKIKNELEQTRQKAEAAIQKSEQIARQIRQQAEQESSQIKQKAVSEAERLREELNFLRNQEASMKQQLESELASFRQQVITDALHEAEATAEQARNIAIQEAEHARQLAEKEAQQAIELAEKARQKALEEAELARSDAEQTKTNALLEAEKTRAEAEQARQLVDKLKEDALLRANEAETVRRNAELEAENIRQAALQEAERIKQSAINESNLLKSATNKNESIISHDNVFDLDDEPGETLIPITPYADEESMALKMAEEIKARLQEVEDQRVKNEQAIAQKQTNYTAQITRLDGKTILESEQDLFVFKEPKNQTDESKYSDQTAITEHSSESNETSKVENNVHSYIPVSDKIYDPFNPVELPKVQNDINIVQEEEKSKRSILAIAASIFLIVSLSLVAYTTKIQINFTEVAARVNKNSIENEEKAIKEKARKDFKYKISNINR